MIGNDSGLVPVVVGFILFMFGFGFNQVVSYLQEKGYDEGYTAILVVFGVGVTLVGVAFIDWNAAVTTMIMFACSGFWMVIGGWWRHVRRRRAGQQTLRGQTG